MLFTLFFNGFTKTKQLEKTQNNSAELVDTHLSNVQLNMCLLECAKHNPSRIGGYSSEGRPLGALGYTILYLGSILAKPTNSTIALSSSKEQLSKYRGNFIKETCDLRIPELIT